MSFYRFVDVDFSFSVCSRTADKKIYGRGGMRREGSSDGKFLEKFNIASSSCQKLCELRTSSDAGAAAARRAHGHDFVRNMFRRDIL